MTPIHVGLLAVLINMVIYALGIAFVWGKFSNILTSVKADVEGIRKLLYNEPGSGTRLITLNECVKQNSSCWQKLNAAFERYDNCFKDARKERKANEDHLDRVDHEIAKIEGRVDHIEKELP